MQSLALADVRDVLEEFLHSIGDEGQAADAEKERNRVRRMLTAIGFKGSLETVTVPATNSSAAPAAVSEEPRGEPNLLSTSHSSQPLSSVNERDL